MKILIISGFLGAGKTTFIRELVRRTGRAMAILENEYAAAGVDGGLLENSLPPDKKLNIWELTEGCICCSMKGDFAASVLTIANTLNPEYLIVEPTGVGMLSSVIASLQQIEYERITLLAPVTIVDGKSVGRYLTEYPDIFKDQILAASTLVVSKLEQADNTECRAVDAVLRKMNPKAAVLLTHYSLMDDNWWNGLLERGYRGERLLAGRETAENLPQSYTLENVYMNSLEELLVFLEDLIRGRFGNLFRAKGVLSVGRELLCFDVSDGQYAVTSAETPGFAGTENRMGTADLVKTANPMETAVLMGTANLMGTAGPMETANSMETADLMESADSVKTAEARRGRVVFIGEEILRQEISLCFWHKRTEGAAQHRIRYRGAERRPSHRA